MASRMVLLILGLGMVASGPASEGDTSRRANNLPAKTHQVKST
jgi:hypothetical protein